MSIWVQSSQSSKHNIAIEAATVLNKIILMQSCFNWEVDLVSQAFFECCRRTENIVFFVFRTHTETNLHLFNLHGWKRYCVIYISCVMYSAKRKQIVKWNSLLSVLNLDMPALQATLIRSSGLFLRDYQMYYLFKSLSFHALFVTVIYSLIYFFPGEILVSFDVCVFF